MQKSYECANAHEFQCAKQFDCNGEKSEAKAVHYFSSPPLRPINVQYDTGRMSKGRLRLGLLRCATNSN